MKLLIFSLREANFILHYVLTGWIYNAGIIIQKTITIRKMKNSMQNILYINYSYKGLQETHCT